MNNITNILLAALALILPACAHNPPMKQGNVEAYDYTVFYVGFDDRKPPVCQAKRVRLVAGKVRLEC